VSDNDHIDKHHPISKEEREALKVRVKMVAEKMGMKNAPILVVTDSIDPAANYYGHNGPEGRTDIIYIPASALKLFTPRELNAMIAHELGHRENFLSGKESKMTLLERETSAEEIALRKWGDPDASISMLSKFDKVYASYTDEQIVQLADGLTSKRLLKHFKKASDEERKHMVDDAKARLNKFADDHPHLEGEDRTAFIRNVAATADTPALRERAQWTDKLNAIETQARGLADATDVKSVPGYLTQLLEAAGVKDVKDAPDHIKRLMEAAAKIPPDQGTARALEEAKVLGRKLLTEIPLVRDEQVGYDMKTLTDMALGSGQEKEHAMLPQMRKALAEYAASGQKQAQGNYLPIHKTMPEGKFIT